MVGLARLVVAEPANIWLHTALLLNLHSNNLDLVVSKANLDLEHFRHDKLISLNRVEVVLLLLLAVALHYLTWDMNLIVLPIHKSHV